VYLTVVGSYLGDEGETTVLIGSGFDSKVVYLTGFDVSSGL